VDLSWAASYAEGARQSSLKRQQHQCRDLQLCREGCSFSEKSIESIEEQKERALQSLAVISNQAEEGQQGKEKMWLYLASQNHRITEW